MWLMTKHGFYSIVEKKSGEFHIRSRERKDLENLVRGIPLSNAQILESDTADYAFRIIVKKEDVLAVLNFLGETLDYDNFKDKVDRTPDQKHKPYHKIWGVMADALGAYETKR